MTHSAIRDMRAEIGAANEHFMAEFATGDSARIAACYTADGALLPPGSEMLTGHDAIAAFWRGAVGMGIASARLETQEVAPGDSSATEIGRYTLLAADGSTIDHGKYIVLWKRADDGSLKLHRDIWNSSVAPAST